MDLFRVSYRQKDLDKGEGYRYAYIYVAAKNPAHAMTLLHEACPNIWTNEYIPQSVEITEMVERFISPCEYES